MHLLSVATVSVLISVAFTQSNCAASDATWLEWSAWSTCSNDCGACGYQTRTRTCLATSTACNCEGDGVTVQLCNLSVCRYPRPACCNNFKATSINGTFGCAASSTVLTTTSATS